MMDANKEHFSLKKKKRFRIAFTTDQVNYLENEFRKFAYISNVHRREVASILRLPDRAVKIWFQNRRMKEKKEAVSKEHSFTDKNNYDNVEPNNSQLYFAQPSTSGNKQHSMPLLTTFTNTHYNLNPPMFEACKQEYSEQCEPFKTNLYKKLSPKQNQVPTATVNYKAPPCDTTKNMASTSAAFRASAEFSIDLYKKYKNGLVNKNDELKTSKSGKKEVQPMELSMPSTSKKEIKYKPENEPEDLSYSKSHKKTRSESSSKSVSPNIGFQPVIVANYAQPYVSAGNMLWKPVLPIMPSTSRSEVTIPSNISESLSVLQNHSVPKKPCTRCDCYVPTPVPSHCTETNPNSHTQYILTAVPVQSYPKLDK